VILLDRFSVSSCLVPPLPPDPSPLVGPDGTRDVLTSGMSSFFLPKFFFLPRIPSLSPYLLVFPISAPVSGSRFRGRVVLQTLHTLSSELFPNGFCAMSGGACFAFSSNLPLPPFATCEFFCRRMSPFPPQPRRPCHPPATKVKIPFILLRKGIYCLPNPQRSILASTLIFASR